MELDRFEALKMAGASIIASMLPGALWQKTESVRRRGGQVRSPAAGAIATVF